MDNSKRKLTIFKFIWIASIILILGHLTFHFFPIGDDLAFASNIERHIYTWKEIVTVNGVNGRYLGNTLGYVFSYLSMSNFWYIRALFNLVFMALLMFFSALIIDKDKQTDTRFYLFFLVSIGLLMSNKYHYLEQYAYSAGFMNYLVPIVLLLFNICFIKKSINNNSCNPLKIFFICILNIVNCFFIEHLTVYILFCCLSFLIYSLFRKKNLRISIPLFISSLIGIILMFSYPLLCYDPETTYRESVLSNGLMWLINNVVSNASLLIFDHLFLTLSICLVCSISILLFPPRKLYKRILGIFVLLICGLSALCSLVLYFSDFGIYALRILKNDISVAVLTILLLASLGIVIFVIIPSSLIRRETYGAYISVWFISAVLSAVSPLGPRCFLFTFVLLNIVVSTIWIAIFDSIKCGIRNVLPVILILAFIPYISFICHSYSVGNKVNNERLQYLDEHMNNDSSTIIAPDSVNFTDCGGLRFLKDYYYSKTPGDIEIQLIPYEEWLKIK